MRIDKGLLVVVLILIINIALDAYVGYYRSFPQMINPSYDGYAHVIGWAKTKDGDPIPNVEISFYLGQKLNDKFNSTYATKFLILHTNENGFYDSIFGYYSRDNALVISAEKTGYVQVAPTLSWYLNIDYVKCFDAICNFTLVWRD